MNYYGTSFWAPTDSLAHFGIKGMKWGVRRYQNADGSLTSAGRKRYYGSVDKIQKDIDSFKGHEKGIYGKKGRTLLSETDVRNSVKALEIVRDKAKQKGDAKRNKDYQKIKKKLSVEISKKNYSSKEEAKNDIKSRFPSESIPNINELRDSYSSFIKAANNHSDFFDSKECADASNKAYNDTISWFRENDPNYLNTIIKNNGGSEAGLDDFHDFRKMFEGYEDTYWQEAEEKFYRNESNRKAKETEDRAYEKYVSECKKAVNSILGDYGFEEIKSLADPKYFWNKPTVRDMVTNVVEEYSYDKIRRNLDE